MATYKTAKDLAKAVEDNGGVLTVTMEEVRDACGFERLRSNIVRQISVKLETVGLGHMPAKLPEAQHRTVRLHMESTVFGKLLDASRVPGKKGDQTIKALLDLTKGSSASKVLRAKELVEQLGEVLDE